MLNDPYIEITNRTRSLNLEETLVENAIDLFLKEGSDKTFSWLVQEKKTPGAEAWQLIKIIKKEMRSSYYQNALYTGAFMLLFLFVSFVLFWFSEDVGFWMIFCFIIFIYFFYRCAKNLANASRLR
jgi:hypothetical protein